MRTFLNDIASQFFHPKTAALGLVESNYSERDETTDQIQIYKQIHQENIEVSQKVYHAERYKSF